MKNFQAKHILILSIILLQSKFMLGQWTVIPTVSSNVIWHLTYADENTVYAVGDSLLMKSIDGGHSWIDLLPNLASLASDGKYYNLCFLNKDTGFIYRNSASQNLLRTQDGGLTWVDVSNTALPYGLLDMMFVNQSVGYAVGGFLDSTMAKTVDGGLTWIHVVSPVIYSPAAVYFINDSIGFMGTDEIYKTTDGGTNWTLTTAASGWISNSRIMEYKFFNSQIGFALTDQCDLYKTTNGGDYWEKIIVPVSFSGFWRGLDFDQNQFGYLMGYSVHQPFISIDGGNSWVLDASYPSYYPSMCVSISPGHKVIIGTSSGEVVLKEHYPLSTNTVQSITDITLFPNPSNGQIYLNSNEQINSIVIYNIFGECVGRFVPLKNNNVYSLDLNHLPKGLYIVMIGNDLNSIQRKLILE